MKKLLLSIFCITATTAVMAQLPMVVDRSLYKDYTPKFNPDAGLMRHVKAANKRTRAAQTDKLPEYVNNANAKWFPPIFGQTGGSCGVSSRVGYMMTYEWNAFRLSDASKLEHRLPPHFQYPFSYNGLGKEEMAMYVGYPTGDVYGGWDVSSIYGAYEVDSNDAGWMQGYDSWYNAMFNRISRSANFPKGSNTKEGMEAIKRWLYNHNGDTTWPTVTDENGTHIVGGIAGLGCGISGCEIEEVPNVEENRKAGVVGKHFIRHWRFDTADHAITLVGYDDRVVFDLDKNGKYGEASNRLGQNEKGAWIFANSWGNWNDNGLCYVPYPMAGGVTSSRDNVKELTNENGTKVKVYTGGGWWPEIYYLRQNYAPKQTLKVTMQYSKRSEISVKVGVSQNVDATSPEKESVFRYINYTGDGDKKAEDAETPLLGRWADGKMHYEPMEFGIDLTDLCEGIDFSKPVKLFFIINSKGSANGNGVIKNVSMIDYTTDKNGVEFPFATTNENIKVGGQTTIVSEVIRTEAMNAPYNLVADNNNNLSWQKPLKGSVEPSKYYVYCNGKKVSETTNTQYTATNNTNGTFAVKAVYMVGDKEVLSSATNTVAFAPQNNNIFDKDVLNFTSSGGFNVPNVTSKAHQKFTIEYWLKPSSIKNWNQKIGQGWGTFWLHTNDNKKVTFGWNTNGNNRTDSEPILNTNQWVHLALVVNGHTMTLYANGEQKGTFTSQFHSGMPAMSGGLLFGAHNGDGLHGSIDEVRIWDVARTQQEIKDNYKTPIAVPQSEEGLLAYFKMNTINVNGKMLLCDAAHGNHADFLANGSHNYSQDAQNLDENAALATPVIRCASKIYQGELATFTANTSVGVVKRQWTVTNGTPENTTANNASVVFNQAGEQTVTLTVTDTKGNTKQATKKVTVIKEDATAEFMITNQHPKASDRVSFLSNNKVSGCSYLWTINGADVTTSTHRNTSAVFAKAGTYQVTLKVTTADNKTLTTTKRVTVEATAPKANYKTNSDDNIFIKGNSITLTDQSKYEPTEWHWTLKSNNRLYFASGNTYTVNPDKAGVYKLYYTVDNSLGSDQLIKERAIIVCNADAQRGLNFTKKNDKQYLTFTTGSVSGVNSNWTIDYWLKPTYSSSASNGVYLLNSSNQQVACLMAQAKGLATLKVGNNAYQIKNEYFIPGQWHHYAITANGSEVKLYRDGNEIMKITLSSGSTINGIAKVRIGGEAQAEGIYDEVRVWGTALNKNDIQKYCVAPLDNSLLGSAKSQHHLKCYYQFNDVEAKGTITDKSGNNCTGKREHFGPDGDAFVSSKGAFALDFSQVQGESINGLQTLDRSSYRIISVSDEETAQEGNGNGVAELMFDKSEESFYHSKYGNGQAGFPHSFVIDRPYLDKIKAIKLTCKRESRYRPISLSVEQSDNLLQWEKVDNQHPFFDMQSPCINLIKPVTKRYIRLTFTESAAGSNLLTINNLELYGEKGNDASTEQPVKLNFVGCSDQKNNKNNKGSNAVDGKENTIWMCKDDQSYPHTLTVKTNDTERCIERLEIIHARISGDQGQRQNSAGKVIIYESSDGTTWKKHEEVRIPYYQKCTIRLQKPIYKQHIKFEFTESQYKGSSKLGIKELKAFGRLSKETGIKQINNNANNQNNIIYNLQGLQVGTSTGDLPAGVYIRNGKKFVIK